MKKVFSAFACGLGALLLTSCAVSSSPLTGVIYNSVKAPAGVTSNCLGTKVGTSEATSILGIVATGDASIEAAAKSAGIQKISHVDYETKSVLGIFAKYKTIVYGDVYCE